MTAIPVLTGHQTAARLRANLDTAALGLPGAFVLAALGWRLFGMGGAVVAVILGLAAVVAASLWRARRYDRRWLIGALDARVPRFEDSTALLFRDRSSVSGLTALQRDRLEERLHEAAAVDLRPGWSRRPIAIAWGAAVVLIAAVLLWPAANLPETRTAATARPATVANPPVLTGARLRIIPPAYTGLPVREQTALDARVPEGSRVEWLIDFAPQPSTAGLEFPENTPVSLIRDGTRWTGARIVDRPMLYRVEAPGLPQQRLNRLDAVADAEPAVRLVEPESQLVQLTPGQTTWTPVFEASDDYGVIETATLRITVTKGDGENITFEQRTMPLRGQGAAKRMRFSTTLNLAREGMAAGSDLIVQLVVTDTRSPERHMVEGPSVILRWPTDLEMAEGLDGMAMRIMPAYFASQRQIIINAEALIARRRTLTGDPFMDASNTIGEEQAALRLRYGQFMGEEVEGGGSTGGIALPTADAPAAPALPTSDTPSPRARPAEDHADQHDDHGGEDHADEAAPGGMGAEVDVLHQFGHAHDDRDVATLFQPRTRSALARAIDAMWASERELRQGRPEAALPHANEALELLKEAQRASRIFLRRVGSDLPPVDFSRRLTGEREGIVAEDPTRPERSPADAVAADAWRALEERPGSGSAPLPLGALDRWVQQNGGRIADPLALRAAIDTVRNEPACLDCRRRLRALLWTALQRPAPTPGRREAPGARGQRYLDALR
ncbi:DUF4175 family protein [Brevundimonas sp. NIBR11]|uniref:DUF4175 family protein n=1 Tax=Brevundimonas sp. NIBR11 TaxID=3015999 RepID=UPI0022F1324E|nr:DUF4175 family protein [Brevundimonas sp. NIBR11]WGM31934.1 hypothetical protein KKHFBJBL_02185 [Brevundimonas sp. NIBR11]